MVHKATRKVKHKHQLDFIPESEFTGQDPDYLVHVHTKSGGKLMVHRDALQYVDLDSISRAFGPGKFSSSS